MIKNVALKKVLKNTIFPVLSFVNKIIPKKKDIVFLYSANGGINFCNLTLRSYLLGHGYNHKYKIVCGIETMKFVENIPNVSFVSGMRAIFTFLQSSHVFYTAGQLPIKPSKKQCVIHMQHGTADYKRMGKSTGINNGDEFFFTFMAASSELYIKPYVDAYGCNPENIAIVGDPMCDELLLSPKNTYDFEKYDKMLLWVPTFRQSDEMGYDDSHLDTLVPLFKENEYIELNEILCKFNIHLIIKLHPAQTAPANMQRHYSHLSVYSHKEFNDSAYDIYKLMAQSDGLIGDYSSASMQYLLMNRPMAYVVPDIDDYGRTRGFVFENPEEYMGGHIIKTKQEFYDFLSDFAHGNDLYKDKRHWVCDQIYKYHDAHSCERVVKLSGMSLD